MSLKNLSNVPESAGQPSRLNVMKKPSTPTLQNQAVGSIIEQKTSKPGYSTLTYLLAGAASLVLLGGFIYIGYELTKPTKKTRLNKVTKAEDEVKNTAKEESKVSEPVKTPTPVPSDRHEVPFERKPNEDIGILLCPGEEKQPGAFVAANKANEDLGLEIGAQLLEINGKVLDTGMSCKDILQLLAKSCSPNGKLCFKKNPALGKKWKEAEVAKENGNIHFKSKELDEAITKYTTAIQIHPTNMFYYSNKAFALYSKAKANPEMAKEIYSEALSLCHTIQELDVLQNFKKGHHIRGVILFELCRYEEAKKAFETYLQIDSNNKKIIARLEECEKALAAASAAKVANEKKESDDQTGAMQKNDVVETDVKTNAVETDVKTNVDAAESPVKQTQNESPSPVLVEKPSPTEVTEVEPLGGNGQKEAEIAEDSPEKVIDDSSVTDPVLTEEKKDDTGKSLDDGDSAPALVKKD